MGIAKCNRLVMPVHSHCDAYYTNGSHFLPLSKYICGTQGSTLPYDPLKVLIDICHGINISVEAWFNPFRVTAPGESLDSLDPKHPIFAAREVNPNIVKEVPNKGWWLNPGVEDARLFVVNAVADVSAFYKVDAISFDDYFYPTMDEDFDKEEYDAAVKAGETKTLHDWRVENVNEMMRAVREISGFNSEIPFGVSPQGNHENNILTCCADVETWYKEKLIDFICPQIYYGFKNEYCPFQGTFDYWEGNVPDDITYYAGLAAYKVGKEDAYAGQVDEAKDEWSDPKVLTKQIGICRDDSKCQGVYLFDYKSMVAQRQLLHFGP
jgi:uncharacterized lipoprotein YddW (UPF0748 family)